MKKLIAIALVTVLAISLFSACEVNIKTPGASENTPDSGELTLGALKKAAKDAGFAVEGGWQLLTNWTSLSDSKAEPENSFQISVKQDGSNFMGICVIEFATEDIAKEYVAFAASDDAYFNGNAYRSGVFTVTINGSLVADHEAKLMEALATAGWVTD